MATTLSPLPVQSFRDNNGHPLSGGLLYTYSAGTTTPLATYTDSTGVTSNTNPVVLNSRGEAQVWIPPNVGYKFLLTDSSGNTIPGYPVDQIVNSQLLTLYGGVDTGIVNAYVLNFSANFTGYTDGIVIYWLPANTDTGPSTINVNGLGAIALQNPNGSALRAGQVVAGQPATILIVGGAALLVTPAELNSGSTTAPLTGFTGTVTATVLWKQVGSKVTLVIPAITGTSNANSMQLIIPPPLGAALAVNTTQTFPVVLEDNGTPAFGIVTVSTTILLGVVSVNLIFGLGAAGGNFTASGTKGIPQNLSITYDQQ